ncbi:MAG: class I SAM-dependent methyltransferase [Phycisphaerales bacterium JB040]
MGATTKQKRRGKGKKLRGPQFTADTADRHVLYQLSVQNVEAEIDFVDAEFERLRGRRAVVIREDFCGTGNTSCEWVRRRAGNRALGLDIDRPTLDWGHEHNLPQLSEEQRGRVSLLERDVLTPGDAVGVDAVLAMNFSYWCFKTRDELRGYFRTVRESLAGDGVLFMDFYGGSEAHSELTEDRPIEGDRTHGPFTYVWEQAEYNPVTGDMTCHISFRFPDKTKIKRAFTYHWRLWTLPEIRELLLEAGFSECHVYWEGDELDDDGEPTGDGNGEFTPTLRGEADPAYICYITALK